jgi:cellulase (glycosyl hydrolase family 5)
VSRRTCAITLVCGLLSLAAATSAAAAGPPAITVSGSHLLEDGRPWIPRGVQIVGLVAPDTQLAGKYVAAHAHYSANELALAQADGADVIRFQVSQFGLDPLGSYFSPAYVDEVANAVQTARGLGLAVIVSLQAEPPSGITNRCPLPDSQTERVWQELAPMFAGDPGVMLELYNEPDLPPTAADWAAWLNGGPVSPPSGVGCIAVGMQQLVDVVRAAGASNVIIVPGLVHETTLLGMPPLTDPASPSSPQLAYGIHYPLLTGGTPVWDATFGRLAALAPVIVTEWDANSTTNCVPNAPTQSSLLLDYLAVKQIGVVGFAFDLPGTIISDYSTWAPTSYASFACGVPGSGPGQLLFGEFAGIASASPLSRTRAIPAWVISARALAQLEASDEAISSYFFDTPRTFVTGAGSDTLTALSVPAAIPTASFTSETALASAVESGSLAPGTRAVVLDLEHWARTPVAEQRRPGSYYALAAQIAHRYGLLLIADPASNLALARSPRLAPSMQYAKFIQLRIAASAARFGDVYEIDARGPAPSGPVYTAFVQAAAAQALAAAPDVTMLATLTSGPRRLAHRSAHNLLGAALGAPSVVSGFQINDLRPGGGCGSCSVPPAAMATKFLREYASAGG